MTRDRFALSPVTVPGTSQQTTLNSDTISSSKFLFLSAPCCLSKWQWETLLFLVRYQSCFTGIVKWRLRRLPLFDFCWCSVISSADKLDETQLRMRRSTAPSKSITHQFPSMNGNELKNEPQEHFILLPSTCRVHLTVFALCPFTGNYH